MPSELSAHSTPPGNNLPPGVWFFCRRSADGTLTYESMPGGFEELFEISADELGRLHSAGLKPLVPNNGPALLDLIQQAALQASPWNWEVEVRTPRTGRELWVRVHALPRREPDGSTVWTGVIVGIFDF
jgi:hypothetical protein